jgi:GcrA cell cycle regulator
MWGEGQSASQIAKELGGVTRNAVIGKVHRLGLSNRAGSGAAPAAPAATPQAAAKSAAPMTEPARPATPPRSPAPEAVTETTAKAASADDDDDDDSDAPPMSAARRAIIPAGQPLPPQPSLNEISPEALAKVNEVEKTARRLTLMELTEKTCKWPVGDPATENFWFCGLAVQQGKPYCEAHVGVAFQPMSARRDRRR